MDVVRAGRGPTCLGVLRPAGPQGGPRLHRDGTGHLDRAVQHRRRRVEEVDDGRRWTFGDTPRLSTYVPVVNAGPFHERRAERDGYDLGLYCRQSLASYLDRDAEELFDITRAGPGVLRRAVRDAVPAAPLRPGVRARHGWRDGELRLRDLERRRDLPQQPDPRPAGGTGVDPAARDGAHVVRRHRHDALVGRPVAQRGVRRVGRELGDGGGHRVHRQVGRLPHRREARRLPRRPGADDAPDPAGGARRRPGSRRVRRHHLLEGRERPQAAGRLRRRGRLRGRPADVLREARVGQRQPRRPGRRAGRRERPRPVPLGDRLARDRRHRRAVPGAHRRPLRAARRRTGRRRAAAAPPRRRRLRPRRRRARAARARRGAPGRPQRGAVR